MLNELVGRKTVALAVDFFTQPAEQAGEVAPSERLAQVAQLLDRSLKQLRAESRVKILRFNDGLIKVFGKLSKEVLADTAAKDPLTRKVYNSYMAFLAGMMDWMELSERGYLDTRRLALT